MARRSKDGTIQASDKVLAVLAGARCTGHVLHKLEQQLDRADYLAVNEILTALGGRWTKASKALPGGGHVFPEGTDAHALLEGVLLSGVVADPHRGDFFETPEDVAAMVARLARIKPGMTVLDAGAGHGRLAKAARAAGGVVTCIEDDPARCKVLADASFPVVPHDFLSRPPWEGYDVVITNPPFSRMRDVAFVEHGLRFLRPGGRLVAIMSPGWTFRQEAAAQAFRALYDRLHGSLLDLPAGTFKASGTMVRAGIVELADPRPPVRLQTVDELEADLTAEIAKAKAQAGQ